MRPRKIILRSLLLILVVIIVGGVWYAWRAFPLISGFGAKNVCSAVFLQHRDPKAVIEEELSMFPLSLGSFTVNEEDSSVTGSVWGFARRKAIYRHGLGSTIVNDVPEDVLRKQRFVLPTPVTSNRDSIPWPSGDMLSDTFPSSIDKQGIDRILGEALNDTFDGKPVHTRALVVLYDGQLISEKYAPGYDKNTVMLGWSVSKSLIGALIGILVKEGKLDINMPAPVPEWKGTNKESITVRHLLQQTTGLDFAEVYSSPSEVTRMLFNKGDMAAYTAKRPLKHDPGTMFNYTSGNSNILSRIIRHTVGEREYASYPYTALFRRIGMNTALLEPDASGTYIGSSYSYASARDFARFGLLYYNEGKWNGEQVLPEKWVKESIEPVDAAPRKNYGYQFWLNGKSKTDSTQRWLPDVPADMFFADGFGGQDIYIIPSKKLVVVRLGLRVIDENGLLRAIIEKVRD
ncbi:MAG: serine hydrolase [Chitinophagaceae bacterium]|nr:serine hydrolase [Chitinophagaceae bacterium]